MQFIINTNEIKAALGSVGETYLWAGDESGREPNFQEENSDSSIDGESVRMPFLPSKELQGSLWKRQVTRPTRSLAREQQCWCDGNHKSNSPSSRLGLYERRNFSVFCWGVLLHSYRDESTFYLFQTTSEHPLSDVSLLHVPITIPCKIHSILNCTRTAMPESQCNPQGFWKVTPGPAIL